MARWRGIKGEGQESGLMGSGGGGGGVRGMGRRVKGTHT